MNRGVRQGGSRLKDLVMRRRVVGVLAVSAGLVLSAGPAMAAGSSGQQDAARPMAYKCMGGEIPSGAYSSITVAGPCSVGADAMIRVTGSVTVRPGAVLDAQTAPSTITVRGNVTAAPGSLLGLGCQSPAYTGNSGHECAVEPDGHSVITVYGSITAIQANTVLLNGITVKHNVTLTGGGGDIPWSIKNNMIGGSLSVRGQTTSWLGVLFNSIGKDATLTQIVVVDVDPGAPGVYVVRNTVGRDLTCRKLSPGVSGGFVPGEVNVVGRHATGQCASLV